MISFSSFSDELVKIAEELAYRREGGVELANGIPLVRRLSQAPEKAKVQLLKATSPARKKAKKVLGYANVAVHEDMMPDLKEMGFKATRIATPLPGERVLSRTWRAGKLHVHKQGPFFLVHQDKESPMGRFGYLNPKALKHGLTEGVPSMIKRIKEKQPLVRRSA